MHKIYSECLLIYLGNFWSKEHVRVESLQFISLYNFNLVKDDIYTVSVPYVSMILLYTEAVLPKE
jgi:hypothetical protein